MNRSSFKTFLLAVCMAAFSSASMAQEQVSQTQIISNKKSPRWILGPQLQILQAELKVFGSGPLSEVYRTDERSSKDFQNSGFGLGYRSSPDKGWGFESRVDYMRKTNVETKIFDFTFSQVTLSASGIYSWSPVWFNFFGATVSRFTEPEILATQFGIGTGYQAGFGFVINRSWITQLGYYDHYYLSELQSASNREKIGDVQLRTSGPQIALSYWF